MEVGVAAALFCFIGIPAIIRLAAFAMKGGG